MLTSHCNTESKLLTVTRKMLCGLAPASVSDITILCSPGTVSSCCPTSAHPSAATLTSLCFWNTQSILLPQGLCTCFTISVGCYSSK